MMLHKIWIGIAVLAGLPVAGLGLLLVTPAALDRSPAALLLVVPVVLVTWAIVVFVRLVRSGRSLSSLRGNLLAFYIVTGAVSVWASTWEFSRDGVHGQMFSPLEMLAVSVFFLVPIVHLMLAPGTTEPGASPNGGRAEPLGGSGVSGGPPSVS
jgi:hypothetical protein